MGIISSAQRVALVLGYVWRHPSNRGRRLVSVLRAVNFQLRGRLGLRTVVTIGDSTRMWAVLHRTASAKVVYGNPPDFPEMMAWARLLRPGDLFLDIGSNVGSYSLWAADRGAEVIAVEPSAQTADLLRSNVALNSAIDVTVHQCALAGDPGRMVLSEGLDAVNHLVMEGAGESVVVKTLDELLGDRVAAGVKIDVEGAERLVLDGATEALATGRLRVLQLEWNQMSLQVLGESREPVVAILQRYGYTFHRPDRYGRLVHVSDLAMAEADLFAVAPHGDQWHSDI